LRINIGCGLSPTPSWRNFDNSPSLRLARFPLLVSVLKLLRLLDDAQLRFIAFSTRNSIEWADVSRRIPLADGSVEVLYTSHMLEHLDRSEARSFLGEARRVLRDGGIIRIAVPDLALYVGRYVASGDADALVEATLLAQPKPHTLSEKLKALLIGGRHHHWMYDGASLCRLLEQVGFDSVTTLEPGQTRIPNSGQLDLSERASESVYVEAVRQ
jgi:SAM-dependent methyltransferase